jgi:hypothetical protein
MMPSPSDVDPFISSVLTSCTSLQVVTLQRVEFGARVLVERLAPRPDWLPAFVVDRVGAMHRTAASVLATRADVPAMKATMDAAQRIHQAEVAAQALLSSEVRSCLDTATKTFHADDPAPRGHLPQKRLILRLFLLRSHVRAFYDVSQIALREARFVAEVRASAGLADDDKLLYVPAPEDERN